MEYISEFIKGSGTMLLSAIEFYKDGKDINRHSWAMGGETRKVVGFVPEEIAGYKKQEQNK